MISCKEARKLAKRSMSEKRYHHTCNVAAAARILAGRFGVDPDKAELAGWLHDVVKERSREDLLQLMERDAIIAKSTRPRPLPVWHGPCAAVLAKTELGVEDADILSALACHTTGRAGMSTFDKVLFLADVISEEHRYPWVDNIRHLAQTDLDAAVVAAMEQNIEYLKKRGKPLDTETVAALDDLRGEKCEK